MDWVAHVEAADQAGVTLSSYAREQGFSVQALYRARRRMKELEDEARSACELVPPFVEVKVGAASRAPAASVAPRAQVLAHLPSGVSVELLCTSADVGLLVAMMDSLGRTACSASTQI